MTAKDSNPVPSSAQILAWLLQSGDTFPPMLWVAYSGGVDSHVLLDLLNEARALPAWPSTTRLGAIHVNHGLQDQADDWERHCLQVCDGYGIDFAALAVDASPARGDSPEAAARDARYLALADRLPAGHWLLTAHHQDDQAETLLLQLLRGAGPRGLAAMPVAADFTEGRLLRPLLEYSRDQLVSYANRRGLHWIEDPSNACTGFDRNYLRTRVMPRLHERWPGAAKTLQRAAAHQAEVAGLLDQLAATDLSVTAVCGNRIALTYLRELNAARRRNLLRFWLRGLDLPMPDQRQLAQAERDLLHARDDAEPCVAWPGAELRVYRGWLYALAPAPQPAADTRFQWDLREPLTLGQAGGVLEAQPTQGQGLRLPGAGGAEIRFRQGGETLRVPGRGCRHTLKHLFQEAGVPPWERGRVPLLYADGQLLAVAGLWVDEAHAATAEEAGLLIRWSRLSQLSALGRESVHRD